MNSTETTPRRLFDFWSGGWILTLAAILVIAVVAWRLSVILDGLEWKESGAVPGRYASNGFDLSTAIVPPEQIRATSLGRDNIRPLTDPAVITRPELQKLRKFLVPSDRVVGVALEGEARAYPIRMLNAHEIVNDTLGGTPIAVTYSPLTDGVVVFERRVGGEVVEFGHSGLLYQTNLLLYDRQAEASRENLWCQLQARAISGPAAAEGEALRILPSSLIAWGIWEERFPETTVIQGRPAYLKKKVYDRNPYGSYFIAGALKKEFPVAPLPPKEERPFMTRTLIVRTAGATHTFFYPEVAAACAAGIWRTTIADRPVSFRVDPASGTFWLTWDGARPLDLEAIHCFWYAAYALGLASS